jgi:hypothetical protein
MAKIRSMIVFFLVVMGVIFTMSLAHADAQIPSAGAWVSTGPDTRSVTDITYGVKFSYDLNNSSAWNGQGWEFSAEVTETTNLEYVWHYSGLHAWFQASAKVTAFVERNGTRTTTVLFDKGVSGGFTGIGISSLQLVAGDTYGFTIYGKNYDSNSFLRGSLNIQTSPHIQAALTGTLGTNGWYTSDVDLSWTLTHPVSAEISSSGCSPISITNDTTIAGVTYTCTASSLGGTSSQTVIIKRDTAAPMTTDNAPEGWRNTDVIVNLTAGDEGSGVAATNYRINGGAPQTGSSVNLTSNGTHTLTYWSVDHAGNVESQRTKTIMIDKPELAAPTFEADITVPTTQQVTVTVTFPQNAENKQVSTDNQAWTAYTVPIVASENQTVYAKYQDGLGNWSHVSHYVISNIDKEAPTTTLTETTEPATNYVTVSLHPTDSGSGIAATYYIIDNGVQQSGNSLQLRAQGLHTITYWSVDLAGNVEEVQSVVVKVELLPIGTDGQFHIDDLIPWIKQGTLQQTDMNDDGLFDESDVRIMLQAITPLYTLMD